MQIDDLDNVMSSTIRSMNHLRNDERATPVDKAVADDRMQFAVKIKGYIKLIRETMNMEGLFVREVDIDEIKSRVRAPGEVETAILTQCKQLRPGKAVEVNGELVKFGNFAQYLAKLKKNQLIGPEFGMNTEKYTVVEKVTEKGKLVAKEVKKERYFLVRRNTHPAMAA